MTVRYDIKQVTRYVLTRNILTDKGDTVLDMAEFRRRDDAERVMSTLRAAIHPATAPEVVSGDLHPVDTTDAHLKVGNDMVVSLGGLEVLKDTASALDLLEARVSNAKRAWLARNGGTQ